MPCFVGWASGWILLNKGDTVLIWLLCGVENFPPLSSPGLVSGCHLGRLECLEEPENSVSALMPEMKSVTLEMKNQGKLLSFFFLKSGFFLNLFSWKALNFMDEDLCVHWMRTQLSEPAAEDSKESRCLLWQWVLRRPSSIPAAKAQHCDQLVVLTCPLNPQSYTLETAFCP